MSQRWISRHFFFIQNVFRCTRFDNGIGAFWCRDVGAFMSLPRRVIRWAQARMRRPLRRWGAVLVALAAVAALWPTIASVFLFDDAPVVRANPLLASGSVGAFFRGNIFGAAGEDLLFRPLLLVSLSVDRALFGNRALPMHAVNVLLHAGAAALLFRVLVQLVDDARRALAAALLFAVHPVHLDAVAFIVNRSEILALLFLLIGVRSLLADPGWRAWLRGGATGSAAASSSSGVAWLALGGAALALGAALLSKETAAGALAVAAVLVAVRGAQRLRPPPSVLAGLALFAVAFAAYLVARRLALGTLAGSSAGAWIQDRRADVLVPTVARIFADYVRLVIVPWPLRVDYSNYVVSTTPLDPRALVAYALHAAVLGSAVVLVRRRPNAAVCIFGFYAALLPVSHLLPFREIEAERFLYIPSVLACSLIALAPPRRAVWLVVALYGLVCLAEATHFHSAEALWSTMVERDPTHARAQYNLGTTWFEAGRCDRALPHLEAAVRLEPGYARAWTNLGECRGAVGDDAGAGEALATAARLDDGNPRAHRNLAVFRALHGDLDGARRELARARALGADAARDGAVQKLIDDRARP
jgi:protein O-mannosyl-transferase